MQQPFLLPGALTPPKRRSNLAPVFVVVFLAVFSIAGYFFWQRVAAHETAQSPTLPVEKAPTPPDPTTAPMMEDLDIHIQNAIQSAVRASELSRQSQRRIRQVMPVMERNYLDVSRSRLEAADSLAEQAVHECNRASEELEVARELTQQKLNEGGEQ